MKNNHLIVETEERVPVNDDDDDPPTFNRPFKMGFTRPTDRRVVDLFPKKMQIFLRFKKKT